MALAAAAPPLPHFGRGSAPMATETSAPFPLGLRCQQDDSIASAQSSSAKSILGDSSPKIIALPESVSPVTLSSSACSSFQGQPTMSQLLLLKRAISKQLEKIESAIDLSENERKKLNFESERIDHSPKSSKMQDNGLTQQSGELVAEVSSHSTSMVPSRDTSLGWNDLPFEQKKVAKERDSRAPDAVDCKLFHTELVEKEASENDSLRAADVGGASSFTSDADQPSVVIVNAPALGNKNASKKYDQEHSDAVALIMDCNSAPVPAMEALDFMGGAAALLANSRPKIYRAELRMPALILDEDDRIRSRFMTSNGRVEDPCSLEKERTMINPWSAEERETFMRMLSLFGKDFAKIASSIAHKTTADCVEFYYKNHKSESFREVRRSLCLRKQQQQQQKGMTAAAAPARSYLLMSGRRLKPASALDMLVMPPMRGTGLQQKPRRGVRKSTPEDVAAAAATKDYEALAAAAAAVPPSSEAVSSCVTTSLDTARMDRQVFDEGACSDEGCSEAGTADWTDEEKCRFVAAVSCSGRDFAGISLRVGTRSEEQCRVFFSKARKSLGLDRLTPLPPPPPPPMAGDQSGNSGSGGEPDDGCVVEIDSAPAGGVPPGQERGAIQDERDWHKAGGDRRQNVDIKLFGQILQRQRVPMRGDGTPRGPDDALSQYSRPKPADR
ncbi:unnamed protein product [Spirodela intermedia]|uniref:SANT domain-containing protein n=1 Tax=Spirodela intermedia TaxID=51605 RepID=A0A7I8K749_SPIIN|nr:unnamed protein product [Spirodela intermedia]